MGNLRDICILVKYRGEAKSLVEAFFTPVGGAAVSHRAFVNTVSKDALRPIAFALFGHGERPFKTQIIINLPTRALSDENPGIVFDADIIDIERDLVKKLENASAKLNIVDPPPEEPVESFDVKICIENEKSESKASTEGFFTDELGSSVAYKENWEDGQSGRELLVSWSWGDPQSKVKQELTRFERIWNGQSTSTRVIEGSDALKKQLRHFLTVLTKTTENLGEDKGGIQLFPHQEKAVAKWIDRPYLGVFKMCTGAGKTISALAAAKTFEVDPIVWTKKRRN